MLAVVKTQLGPGVDVIEWPEPRIEAADEVLVDIRATGICGSDLGYYLDDAQHDLPPLRLPVVLGHEASGVVSEVGADVRSVRPGDRVVLESAVSCGRCTLCLSGAFNACRHLDRIGHSRDGAMAPRIVVPEGSLLPLPDEVDFDAAALLKPLGVALHAMEVARIDPADRVVVLGAGSIGLLSALVARALGASRVIVATHPEDRMRLEIAARLGLETITEIDDAAERIADLLGGQGAQFVVEASGAPRAIDLATRVAAHRGRVAVVGLGAAQQVVPRELIMKELSLFGVLSRLPVTWQRALELLAVGAVDPTPLITHRLPINRAIEGFELLRRNEAVKVILQESAT